MDEIDKRILSVLRKKGDWISAYAIAKQIKTTWATAKGHCFELLAEKKVELKTVEENNKKGYLWRIAK